MSHRTERSDNTICTSEVQPLSDKANGYIVHTVKSSLVCFLILVGTELELGNDERDTEVQWTLSDQLAQCIACTVVGVNQVIRRVVLRLLDLTRTNAETFYPPTVNSKNESASASSRSSPMAEKSIYLWLLKKKNKKKIMDRSLDIMIK